MRLTPSFIPGGLARLQAARGTSLVRRMTCLQHGLTPSVPVRMRATMSGNEPEAPTSAAPADVQTSQGSEDQQKQDLQTAVMQQMEFWFSPSNLRRDWYLRRQMDDDGWLDPAIFLKFNRLKVLNVSLSEVIEACRCSSLLEVSAPPIDGSSFGDELGQTRIRRSADLPTIFSDAGSEDERSIVALNVAKDCSNEFLRDLFGPYGEITYTWVARNREESYAIVSFKEIGMVVDTLESFEENKPESASGITIQPKKTWDAFVAQGRNNSVVVELSGLDSDVTWKALFDEVSDGLRAFDIEIVYFQYSIGDSVCYVTVGSTELADVVVGGAWLGNSDFLDSMNLSCRVLSDEKDLRVYWDKAADQSLMRKKKKRHMTGRLAGNPGESPRYVPPSGVIVRVENLPEQLRWRELKKEVEQLGNVIFLNYRQGNLEAFVRFESSAVAQTVAAKLSDVPEGQGWLSDVSATVLEGESEAEYWANLEAERKRK